MDVPKLIPMVRWERCERLRTRLRMVAGGKRQVVPARVSAGPCIGTTGPGPVIDPSGRDATGGEGRSLDRGARGARFGIPVASRTSEAGLSARI